jgi:hypothetical protein
LLRSRKSKEALKAYIDLAGQEHVKDIQKSFALSQAAHCARMPKDAELAEGFVVEIPIEVVAKTVTMENLQAKRDRAGLIEKFADENFEEWPFWQIRRAAFARGNAYYGEKKGAQANADLELALQFTSEPKARMVIQWTMAFNRENVLKDDVGAPLDFIAELTQQIPEHGAQTVRYDGWYSNKARGMRAKAAQEAKARQSGGIEPVTTDDSDTPYRKLCRMRWSALIKRVYVVDPLCCPKCGGTMAIVSFIEQEDQADVIERILKHCQLWNDYPARAPPKVAGNGEFELEVEYVDFDEFLMVF